MSYIEVLTLARKNPICDYHTTLLQYKSQYKKFVKDRSSTIQTLLPENNPIPQMTPRAYLLSIAGSFDSDQENGSEQIKEYVAISITKKFGRTENGDAN